MLKAVPWFEIQHGIDSPIQEVVTREVEALTEDATIAWVLNMMAVGGFRHVPITHADGTPAFVVSMRDVVDFLVDLFPEDILNLPPRLGAPKSARREGA